MFRVLYTRPTHARQLFSASMHSSPLDQVVLEFKLNLRQLKHHLHCAAAPRGNCTWHTEIMATTACSM